MVVLYGVSWSTTVVVVLVLVCGRPASPLLNVRAHQIRSPCQQVFDYRERSDHYVFGVLTVPGPPMQRRSVPLIVTFQLRARLPTKYGGLIELRLTQDQTVRDIRQRRPVQFIIHFPMQTPLPQLTMVLYDKVLLCGTSTVVSASQQFASGRPAVVNRIEFRYTFDTSDLVSEPEFETTSLPSFAAVNAKWFSTTTRPTTPSTIPTTTTTAEPLRRPRQPHCGQLHKHFISTASTADDDGDTERQPTMERGSWPWLTAIYTIRPSGPRFLCAGSLISSRLIVTAASCLTATSDIPPNKQSATKVYQADELLVMLGRYNMSTWFEPGTVIRELATLHMHPDFSLSIPRPTDADVAVLEMRLPVEYGAFVMPVCLWRAVETSGVAPTLGSVGTVVGWGGTNHRLSDGSTRINPIPESMTISVVPRHACMSGTDASSERTHIFCAGTRNGRRACVGDAGSGYIALHDNRLALRGVMAVDAAAASRAGAGSVFVQTCDEREYYVFTDVSTFIDWIESFMD